MKTPRLPSSLPPPKRSRPRASRRRLLPLAAALVLACLLIPPPLARAALTSSSEARGGSANQNWPLSQGAFRDLALDPGASPSSTIELWAFLPARPPETCSLHIEVLGRSARLPLQWIGWRRLRIPVSVLESDPAAIGSATVLRLRAVGDFPAGSMLHHSSPRVGAASPGPAITDADLLDRIDLDYPGLGTVKAKVALAEAQPPGPAREAAIADAAASLAGYFRSLPSAGTRAGLTAGSAGPADTLCAGTYTIVGVTHTFSPFNNNIPGDINWLHNPTLQPGDSLPDNYEWGYSLNRHAAWETLARAYLGIPAKRAAYSAYWAENLRSWTDQRPAPAVDDETKLSAWRGLEAGLRMKREWPAAFLTFASAPAASVSNERILTFLKSAVDHGDFLAGKAYAVGNHYLLGQCGLFNLGVTLPELRDSAHWRERAADNLAFALEDNTLPDGAFYEGSPDYQNWIVSSVAEVFTRAEANGRGGDIPASLWEKLRRMAEWTILLGAPDRSVPTVNDSAPLPIANTAFTGWETRFSSPLLAWAQQLKTETASDNLLPDTPLRSLLLPDSGYAALRTGWGKNDSYVFMDVGPFGGWHGHQDALNLVAHFFGRPFLFDNGGYTYDASGWRDYGTSSASHNTVLVDGLDQARSYSAEDPVGHNDPDTPPVRFGTSPSLDYVSAWYVGAYGPFNLRPATHRREIAFAKTATPSLLVVDTLTPRDGATHAYDLRWHLRSTKTSSASATVGGRDVRWTKDRDSVRWPDPATQPNLAVVSLAGATEFLADSGVAGTATTLPLGWHYPSRTAAPVPALTLRHRRPATAAPVRFVTLLVPFTGDSSASPVTAITGNADSWTITLRGGSTYSVSLRTPADATDPSFAITGQTLPASSSPRVVWQPGATPGDAAGTWNATDVQWRDATAERVAWGERRDAVFGSNVSLAQSPNVDLALSPVVSSLRFESTGGNQYILRDTVRTRELVLSGVNRPEIYVRGNALVNAITGSKGGFDKTGPGTLRLAADNLFLGGLLRVREGTLQLGNNGDQGRLGERAHVEVAPGTTFSVRREIVPGETFFPDVSGAGALAFQLRGQPLLLGGQLTHSGDTTLASSTSASVPAAAVVSLGGSGSLSPLSTFRFTPNAALVGTTLGLHLEGRTQVIGNLAGGDAGCSVALGGGQLFVGAKGQNADFGGRLRDGGVFTKAGEARLTLSGDNRAFTGDIVAKDGELRLSGPLAAGAARVFATSARALTGFLSLEGGVFASAPLDLAMKDGAVARPALLNIAGDNTWAGPVRLQTGGARWDIGVAEGRLHVSGNVAIAFPATNTTSGDGWRTLHLSATGAGRGEFSGAISDYGVAPAANRLQIAVSSGDWLFSGVAKNYASTTHVNGGRLRLASALTASTVVVNSGGSLTGAGGSAPRVKLLPGAALELRLGDWNDTSAVPLSTPSFIIEGADANNRWVLRIDGAGLANFTEAPRAFVVIANGYSLSALDLAAIRVEAVNFPGAGKWSSAVSGNQLRAVYTTSN